MKHYNDGRIPHMTPEEYWKYCGNKLRDKVVLPLKDLYTCVAEHVEKEETCILKTYRIHSDILSKLSEIRKKYQDYPSYQHAAWIIEEEYREFCAELFKKDSEWDYTKIYKELIDIMAACYRTIIDRDLLSHVSKSANKEES